MASWWPTCFEDRHLLHWTISSAICWACVALLFRQDPWSRWHGRRPLCLRLLRRFHAACHQQGWTSKTEAALLPEFSGLAIWLQFALLALHRCSSGCSTINTRDKHKHNLYLKHFVCLVVSLPVLWPLPKQTFFIVRDLIEGPTSAGWLRTGTLTSDQMVAVGIVNAGFDWLVIPWPCEISNLVPWPAWVLDDQKWHVRG